MNGWVRAALVLLSWWSLWTLADQELIRFHPWPEIAGILVCASVWTAVWLRGGGGRALQARVTAELSIVTQTEIDPVKFDAQVDRV